MGKLAINLNLIILFAVNNFHNRALFKKLTKYFKDRFMTKNTFATRTSDLARSSSPVTIINVG